MTRVQFGTAQLSAPPWRGDWTVGPYASRSLMAIGGYVDPDRFTANANGRKPIKSGTLLGRRSADSYIWEPVINALTTTLIVKMDAAVAASGTVISLKHVSGFVVGDGITILHTDGSTTETKTITAIDKDDAKITVAGLTNAYPVGSTVRLTTAVNQTEWLLLAEDISDAIQYPAIPAFYRPQSLVKINYLPDYPFTSLGAVETKIKALYQVTTGA